MSHSSIEKHDADKHINEKSDHIEHVRGANLHNATTKQVHSAHLAAATAAGALNPWSKESLLLYLCCFIAFLCSCANGYDGSLMTAINGMKFYKDRFTNGTGLGEGTSIIFSIYTVGGIVGPWFAGPITDRLGRRGGMCIGGIVICIGSAVISSAAHKEQFIAGRFILGFGVSIMTCAAPSYIIEVAPPQWRGRFAAFYNCGWFGGSIPAAAITLGTEKIKSDMQWRLPLIFQCVPAGIVVLAVWFLPESPRWLLANGRDAEARAFLTKYHGNGQENNPVVELEWQEFQDGIKLDASDKRWWDYSELFKTHAARWRFLMVALMGVFGQFSGNGLGYFNLNIYESIGYDTDMQFILNLVNSITSAVGALGGVALADRMPRRKVLVIGTFVCAIMLAINGGLSAKWANNSKAGVTDLKVGQGALAAYFFFNIIYSFTYTPLQALYPVECLSTETRAKGMSMYGVFVSLVSFINLYAGPIALKNIAYRYVFIFVGWDIIESILWYFLCVETVGRTLEELEAVFEAPYPVRASTQRQTIAVKQSGGVAIVDDA
ncbi:general substrate transporter [Serendipita vermifera]|nr:general substrate transporter [Serendipita vermifera]